MTPSVDFSTVFSYSDEKMVNILLDEVLASAAVRSIEPETMEYSVIEKILSNGPSAD